MIEASAIIPATVTVFEGVASVDECAITGESAPVIREAGGDRSAVTGGTRSFPTEIIVRITSNPGETFLDRMITLVEGAVRQKTPNEIALNILLAGLTIVFLLATVSLHPFAIYRTRSVAIRALGRARLSDPYDDRRTSFCDRYRRHGSPVSAQCACDVRTRGRSGWRRRHASSR